MPEPSKIPVAFASSGDKNSIPQSSGTPGLASWSEGFPAITSTPFAQGGLAPKRADFNGILNALSEAAIWHQQGGVYAYSNTTDYEVGNVVLNGGKLYICVTANGPSSLVKPTSDATYWKPIAVSGDYVPLIGNSTTTAMTGNLYGGGMNGDWFISMSHDGAILHLRGATSIAKGANLNLYGESQGNNPGKFILNAAASGASKALTGAPDGSLTWDSKPLVTFDTGTWTPVIKGTTTAGEFTYSKNDAYYYKLNNLVFVRFDTRISSCTVQPIGNFLMTGLPFTPADDVVDGITIYRATGGVLDSLRRILRLRFGNTGNVYAETLDNTTGSVVTTALVSSLTAPLSDTTPQNVCIATGTNNIQIAGEGFYVTNQ